MKRQRRKKAGYVQYADISMKVKYCRKILFVRYASIQLRILENYKRKIKRNNT